MKSNVTSFLGRRIICRAATANAKGCLMQTESAKIINAGEARFRIKAPNSIARSIKVVALDPASENALTLVAQNKWNGASFLTASAFTGSPGSKKFCSDWLKDLAGRTRDRVREV